MKWLGADVFSLKTIFQDDVVMEKTLTTSTGGNILAANDEVADNDFLRIDGTEIEGLTVAEVLTALNVEAGADVTDATNVTAAGALMDSELSGIAAVKAFTGNAATVTTITGLAPDTATTQATQPAIESIGTDGDTLTILSDQLTMSNTTSDTPTVTLENTADGTNDAAQLVFKKLRDDNGVEQGQNLGEIWFNGQDNEQNPEQYAHIIAEIDVGTTNEESGLLKLGVASHTGASKDGLILTGGSEANEIDVTVGLGANSVVTVPGNIDLAGDIDVDGTLETDALTIGGTTVAAAGTSSITTVGALASGTIDAGFGYISTTSTIATTTSVTAGGFVTNDTEITATSGGAAIPLGKTLINSIATNTAHKIILPATSLGLSVRIINHDTAFELQISDGVTNKINNGSTSAGSTSTVSAYAIVDCTCLTTANWVCTKTTPAGVQSALDASA